MIPKDYVKILNNRVFKVRNDFFLPETEKYFNERIIVLSCPSSFPSQNLFNFFAEEGKWKPKVCHHSSAGFFSRPLFFYLKYWGFKMLC